MSTKPKSRAKAEQWFLQYLEIGATRSVRKLAAEAQRIANENGWDSVPPERTLFRWSSRDGWDRRAKQFDQEQAAEARHRLLTSRATIQEERITQALDKSQVFHAIIRTAVQTDERIIDPETKEQAFEVQSDGGIKLLFNRRIRTFDELGGPRLIASLMRMWKTTVDEEHMLLGTAASEYRAYQDQMSEGVGVTVLGPEAIMEMGMKIGELVQKLGDETEKRKALGLVKDQSEVLAEVVPEDENPDDPNLYWEEVDEDE